MKYHRTTTYAAPPPRPLMVSNRNGRFTLRLVSTVVDPIERVSDAEPDVRYVEGQERKERRDHVLLD